MISGFANVYKALPGEYQPMDVPENELK